MAAKCEIKNEIQNQILLYHKGRKEFGMKYQYW